MAGYLAKIILLSLTLGFLSGCAGASKKSYCDLLDDEPQTEEQDASVKTKKK